MSQRRWLGLALLAAVGPLSAQDHACHHTVPVAPPSATMAMPQTQEPHAAHPMPPVTDDATEATQPAASRYQPPALTSADRAAAFPVLHSRHDHADPLVWMVQADRFEYTQGDALAWEGKAWIGHDRGRLWLRSEGEHQAGKSTTRLEVLWGKPAGAWWDVLAGVRHDQGAGPSRDWISLGIQGLAPYRFEVQATAYLGNGGRSLLEAEVDYELLLSNRWILQPRVEARLAGRDDVARGIGAGLTETAAGLRLRYEIRREFAPYIGYEWSRRHGRSADLMRAAGEPASESRWVAGVRFWF